LHHCPTEDTAMAAVGSQLQSCCYRSSPRSLPVSHGRCSYRLLTLPSSSRHRHVSSVRASGSRRDRDPAGKERSKLVKHKLMHRDLA
jgi:hypothetical protein